MSRDWSDLRPESIRWTRFVIEHGDARVATMRVTFPAWEGPRLTWQETYGKKQVVGLDGNRTCAEVEIVRRLRAAGWEANWFDSFGKAPAPWRPYTTTIVALPGEIGRRLREVEASAGLTRGGRWDVIAWRGDDVRFIESKGSGDSIRDSQRAWLATACRQGFVADQFAIVDWRAAPGAFEGPGDEARVVAAFERWLTAQGWALIRDHGGWADIIAERDGRRLVAEAKGFTANSGIDADIMLVSSCAAWKRAQTSTGRSSSRRGRYRRSSACPSSSVSDSASRSSR